MAAASAVGACAAAVTTPPARCGWETGMGRSPASWACWRATATGCAVTRADRDHINAGGLTRRGQDELGTILVTHPGHPLWQQTARVVRRYRHWGERQWVIELPDGSRQYIPASWCTPLTLTSRRPGLAADPSDSVPAAEAAAPLGLATLRELAALVRHLQEAVTSGGAGDAVPTDRERGRTIETTRGPGAGEQPAAVAEVGELPAPGAATAGQPAHPGRTAPAGERTEPRAGGKGVSRP
jgi:Family of unknown function (DUF5372)